MRIGLGLLLVLLVFMAAHPALARGRGDVMANAYRCEVIADDAVWLDCFYGSAQPMRAQLGLPSAPDAQVRLATAPPAGGESQNAIARDEAMASAARCYSVTDDREWLNCYYDAVQPIRSLLKLPGAKALPLAESSVFAVRKPAPISGSGFSDWLGGSGKQRIMSHLASYRFDRNGVFTVILANGQIWQQESGDTTYARWKKPAETYTAIITRGALGSIDFQIQGEQHIFKVSRLK
jgi:hypothetical protein